MPPDSCTFSISGSWEELTSEGDLSLVYPLSRGSGPLFVPSFAVILIHEQISLFGGFGITPVIFGIMPDMVVIGKGLGGGVFPLAALIAREELDVAGNRALGHYTHEKSPVACAAALATIDYIEKHRLDEHAFELGRYALTRMNKMKHSHSLIGDVRGLGLFLGLELVKDRETRERGHR